MDDEIFRAKISDEELCHRQLQLLSLKIRSLIVDKEMVIAQANLDLVRAGEWRCDYSAWHRSITEEIKLIMDELERAFHYRGQNAADFTS